MKAETSIKYTDLLIATKEIKLILPIEIALLLNKYLTKNSMLLPIFYLFYQCLTVFTVINCNSLYFTDFNI